MKETALRMEERLQKEISDRNYFQLERDKVGSFWEISKKECEDLRAELRNKCRDMEQQEETHDIEIKVYKQRIGHLLHDHQNKTSDVKIEGESALMSLEDDHRAKEGQLRAEHRALKVDLKSQELAYDDMVKNLKQEYDRHITQLRLETQREMTELRTTMERRMKALKDDLDLQRKQEVHEVEERKNAHISNLIKNHEKAFSEIRSFYNDMTRHNCDSINHYKDEIADLKREKADLIKTNDQLKKQNKALIEPLELKEREVAHLQLKLANYEKDKVSLAASKSRVDTLESQLKKITWEHEVLEQRFEKVQKERDDLYDKFESRVLQVQQRTGLKNLMLEKKVELLVTDLEKKEAQLNEVLVASNLDPTMLQHITAKLDDVLEEKNNAIRSLQLELARVAKAHNDMLRVLESRLAEIGINVEEFGIRPV
eukprot:gnl/Hemi2/7261_TR2471_c0_g2_i1.p1 gnl/Hemi2/7261_TR2471_c0_g2~~gnl/Hemi2/7261_TR2471_c0_g2_i1.p1  ORF type:complete len:428 (+),score=189.07 gnl/Hemi2/7261_TR2471_c0_g2_i1:243-1526(+)